MLERLLLPVRPRRKFLVRVVLRRCGVSSRPQQLYLLRYARERQLRPEQGRQRGLRNKRRTLPAGNRKQWHPALRQARRHDRSVPHGPKRRDRHLQRLFTARRRTNALDRRLPTGHRSHGYEKPSSEILSFRPLGSQFARLRPLPEQQRPYLGRDLGRSLLLRPARRPFRGARAGVRISDITEDHAGRLWIATNEGRTLRL